MHKHAIITGTSGAIGQALAEKFKKSGYKICAIDIKEIQDQNVDFFIKTDLNQFVLNKNIQEITFKKIETWLEKNHIDILINNAAYQYVSTSHPIDETEFMTSYNINVIAPYILISHLKNKMTKNTGNIINIGSIHTKLTKPGFVAYATTKAALAALTRGLALDYEDTVRINCIEPASVETPMLHDGFKNAPESMRLLESYHPQKRIATPNEIAELAFFISSEKIRFLHGACIDISGGISSRLHDPL